MMRLLVMGTAVLLVFGSGAAEAARCSKGKIYRPSLGVCQSKQTAIRQGVYRPRPKAVRVRQVQPPRARTTEPAPGWVAEYHQHVQDWVEKNRASLIRHAEGL
jgi:hypothetical protein